MALISSSGFDLFIEKVNGLEVFVNDEDTYDFSLATLSKSKSKLEANDFKQFLQTNIKSIDIDRTIPLCISLSGKWVINRKVQIDKDDTEQILLSKVLPNATLSDFYLQKYEISDSMAYVSIIRRKVIQDFLQECNDVGLKIISCSLGPFSLQSIFPLIENHDLERFYSDMTAGNYTLAIEKNKIVNITSPDTNESKSINLSGIECPSEYLLSFSVAFSHLIKFSTAAASIPQVNEALTEYRYNRKFRKTGIIYVCVIFCMLLINFLIFSYLNDCNKEIQSKLAISASDVALVDKLKKQIADRANFFTQNGIAAHTRNSFYADQIAATLPSSLSLTQLTINPVKIDDETQKISYTPLVIKIKGNTKYSIEVNEWMKELKKMTWASEATLVNYKQESSGTQGIFDIEMKIK
jgi:hypothetical protein